jgi:hypothetical protein
MYIPPAAHHLRKPSGRAAIEGRIPVQTLLYTKGRQCHRYTNPQDTTPLLISICHFQSRTAEVCLACPTTPCRTKTSYHSLQEPQGASALIHVCLHIWAAKTALLPCLHAAGCMFFLRLWRSWDSLERSLIISWCLGGLPKTWGTLGGEVHSSSLRIQGALIPQPLCISQFCESTHVIYPSHYSVAI